MTETATKVLQWLEQVRDLRAQHGEPGWEYGSPEDFVLRHGRAYEWAPLPEGFEYGEAKQCYANAANLVLLRDFPGASFYDGVDLTYVEGYAMSANLGIAVEHAWVVTPDGAVIDPTWRDADNDECGFCFGEGAVSSECDCSEEDRDYCDPVEQHGTEPCRFCKGTGRGDHPERAGSEYFGVPIPTDVLRETIVRTGTYGIFDDPTVYREEWPHG